MEVKKRMMISLVCLGLSLLSLSSFAGEPIVSHDVPVIQNTTPSECKTTWHGEGPPVSLEVATGYGAVSAISPGILSCSGCTFDKETSNCVCKTCIEEYN